MDVPRAAAEMAAAALLKLDPTSRAQAELPAVIAAGRPLDAAQAATVAEFWQAPACASDPAWRLASALLGGQPLARAVQAAARKDPADAGQPNTDAMTAALVPAPVAERIAVPDGLPAEDLHITLLFHGPTADAHPLARMEAAAIAHDVASRWLAVPVEFTHVAHLGPPDDPTVAVALEAYAPELHRLRRELRDAYTRAGVAWSDDWAFRPHMTVTWLPRAQAEADWPPGPLPEPIATQVTALLVAWGEQDAVAELVGVDQTGRVLTLESPVAAAAARTGAPALNEALSSLTAALRLIDDRAATAVATAIQMGYASALDRVGRMATRAAGTPEAWRDLPPATVAVTAAPADTAGLNVAAMVAPAIADAVAHVRRVLADAQIAAAAEIADTFAVDFDDLRHPEHLAAAADYLEARLTGEVLYRLGVTDVANIDPTEDTGDPLIAPAQLARDTLAIAGGADTVAGAVVRDDAGRPLMGAWHGTDGPALGPYAMRLTRDAIATAAAAEAQPDAVTAEARRRPGARLSDRLRADLAKAAEIATAPRGPDPSGMVTVYTWRLNYNGTAIENLPEHIAHAGLEVLDAAEFDARSETAADINEWPYTGHRYPGDHARCHCGWEPHIEYRLLT